MKQLAMSSSPAGFWKRYVAYFIDVVLVYIVVELLSGLFFSAQDAGELDQLRALLAALQNQQALPADPTALLARTTASLSRVLAFSSFAYVVIGGAYFALCESSIWQATLGKRLLGIKVVNVDGERIGLGRALARFFAAGLSWLSLNIGHALAAMPPEHRALHDHIASTRVENADPTHRRMPLWAWLIVGAHALVFLLCMLAVVLAVAVALRPLGQF